jgi:hypothetical protein
MSGLDSGQQSPTDTAEPGAVPKPQKKKFLNGWTKELETLIADWADKAACYRWMHEKTSVIFGGRDRYFNIPVIILSGVTAGANFALGSIFDPDDVQNKKWAQLGLGGASLVTGIIQTMMNFYRYAQLSEAHRVAGVSWGKFNRLLCIEMNLHPDERMEAFNFLKMFRTELDRLIEQSPSIPEQVIKDFNSIFKNTADVVKPEITGILNHTRVFIDTNSRLKRIAAEATVALHYKRGVIKQMVVDDLEAKTRKLAIEAAKEVAREMLEQQQKTAAAAAASRATAARRNSIVAVRKEERQKELATIAQSKAGTVKELRERFCAGLQLPGMVGAGAAGAAVAVAEPASVEQPASSSSKGTTDAFAPVLEASENIVVQIQDIPTEDFQSAGPGSASAEQEEIVITGDEAV